MSNVLLRKNRDIDITNKTNRYLLFLYAIPIVTCLADYFSTHLTLS